MKKLFTVLAVFSGILLLGSYLENSTAPTANAATITRGITFSATDLVTNTKLHQLVDSATLSAVDTADLSDSAITTAKLGANSVTTSKILNATILGEDIADRTLTGSLYATNSVDGIALSSNVTFRAGTLDFTLATVTSNSIAGSGVSGATNSAGSADQGKIVKLNALGKVDSTMISGSSMLTTNLGTATGSASSYTWQNILTLTTTATNGTVIVTGRAIQSGNSVSGWVRLRDVTTNVVSSIYENLAGLDKGLDESVTLTDSLNGTAKTYYLDVAASGNSVIYTNTAPARSQWPIAAGVSNGLSIRILQMQ